jgi:hypothetical protein
MRFSCIGLIVAFLFFAGSCKTKKSIIVESTNYWNSVEYTLENASVSPQEYLTYKLNEQAFFNQLFKDTVILPDTYGAFNVFFVEEIQVLSAPLAEKFPEIKTFTGYRVDNTLCQCKIALKNLEADITVLCNDRTYFIKKIKEISGNIYVVFDKSASTNTLQE